METSSELCLICRYGRKSQQIVRKLKDKLINNICTPLQTQPLEVFG